MIADCFIQLDFLTAREPRTAPACSMGEGGGRHQRQFEKFFTAAAVLATAEISPSPTKTDGIQDEKKKDKERETSRGFLKAEECVSSGKRWKTEMIRKKKILNLKQKGRFF